MQTILGIGFVFLCAVVIIGVAYLYVRYYLFRGTKITKISHDTRGSIIDDDDERLTSTPYIQGSTAITGTGEFYSNIP